MKLTPRQEERLEEALLSAFPSYNELERMLQHQMGINLNEIVTATDSLKITVHKLVRWAISQERIKELIKKAHQANSGNPELKDFYRGLIVPTLPARLSPEKIFYIVIISLLIVLILAMLGVFSPQPVPPSTPTLLPATATSHPTLTETPQPSHTPTISPSATLRPSQTPTPTKTPTPTETFTPTLSPTITPTPYMVISPKDGMALIRIPAGEFQMGSDPQKDSQAQTDEQPMHPVFLDEYWIDQTEVTNAMYKKCVDAGICVEPRSFASATQPDYYTNPAFANYPVINVTWNYAATYCNWAGRRLPTEAEWEKAARGLDQRIYPWGSDMAPTCNRTSAASDRLANFDGCAKDTTAVTDYNGLSYYGLYGMAGNVQEWVQDWYDPVYYQPSPISNPVGPGSGSQRVLRGGSFGVPKINIRSAARKYLEPNRAENTIGFRCAVTQP